MVANYGCQTYICNSVRFCRITQLMFKLHWLPVKLRIKYKIFLMTYKAIHMHYRLITYKVQFKSRRNHYIIFDLMMKFYWLQQLLNQTRQQERDLFNWQHPLNGKKLPKSLRLEKDLISFKTKPNHNQSKQFFLNFVNNLIVNFKRLRSSTYGACAI